MTAPTTAPSTPSATGPETVPDTSPRRSYVFALGVLILLTTVVSTLAAFANPPADEWLYLRLRSFSWLSAIEWAEGLRSPVAVVLVLAAGLALVGLRCRPLVAALLGSAAATFLVTVVLDLLAGRERPFDSMLTGIDSYPSRAVAVLAVVALIVPIGMRVVGRGRLPAVLAGVLLWTVVLLAGLQEVMATLRWPLDVVGGVLVAATVSVAALAAVEHPSHLHRSCDGCRWQHAAPMHARPPVEEHGGRRHPLYVAALVWSVLLAIGFGVLAYLQGIPRLPESGVMGTGLEVPLNIGLVVLILLSVLLAARWHLTGAILIAFFAILLGYMSSVHYAPWIAVLIAFAGFVPAALLWIQWHRAAPVRTALIAAVAVSAVMGTMVYFAASTHSTFWGPATPRSVTAGPPSEVVDWMWAGGVTDDSVTVRARTEESHDQVRLVVARDAALTSASLSDAVPSRAASTNVVSLTVAGLEPDTPYYYALELDGEVADDRVQSFRTFPDGPSSFSFAISSCSRTGSHSVVYDAIRRQEPLFYLNYGDWFYGDVESNNLELFRRQYQANLTSDSQAALYATTPFAYVWDDHDSTGNDADSTTVGWPAVQEIYRQWVPHYPLRDGDDGPIFQAFTVGDVRFVLTDGRSARVATGPAEERVVLGDEQRGWLMDELRNADRYGLVVWSNGTPWVGKADPTNDTWAGFATERTAISNAIARYDVDNLLMVSGDAHMLAYDDGTHTDYSDSGKAAFPLFQAASLDRIGSVKGGPYTEKPIPGGGQFGIVTVEDDGQTVTVTMTARNYEDEVLFEHTFETTRDDVGSGHR